MYNNETGLWEFEQYLMDGDWYDNENGSLFIIPQANVVAEIEGPDGSTMDELNRLCREQGMPTLDDCDALMLQPVSTILRRFSPKDGYYHA